jgi:nucleotide-binding universal stress UspA family protein
MNEDKSNTSSEHQPASKISQTLRSGISPRTQSSRRVMACLDRSPRAEVCAPYAGFMARALHAELTLVHVIPTRAEADPSAFDVLGWEISRREAEQYLAGAREELEGSALAPESIRTELTQGQPAERVLALERELGTELTVLARGVAGSGGRVGWGLGATAQDVVMNSSGSVLIVPRDMAPVIPPARILVPLDGSQRAESVLSFVLEAARTQDAEVVLLHVVNEPRRSGVLSDGDDLRLARTLASRLQAGGQSYLDGVRSRLLRDISRVKVRVLTSADTREAVLDVARDEKVDLIVLSAHGTTCNADHPFGSVTIHALAHAKLPVLVVQDLPASERRSDRPPGEDTLAEVGRPSLSTRAAAH